MKNKIQSFFITVILLFPLLTFAALDTPIEDFTDNNDGTVTHNKTGLTWQRCAVGQTWTGSTCSGTPSIFTWDSASKLTSTFAGKSDWHVPRIDELKSIIEHSSYSPSLNKTIFPNSTTSAIYIFWSGSSYVSDSQNNLKWSVSFQHGDLLSEAKSLSRAVRLVRGSSTLSSLGEYTSTNDFIDNKDGTVVHKKTVLMWQRCSVGQTWTGSTCTGNATTMHHLEATQQKSNFSSYSDWRLPTINELSSIVEYKNYSASINKSIFPNATSTWFWTISDDFVSPNAASWIVDFINGTEGSYLQGYDYAVRLVRNSAIKDFTDNKDGTVTHNKTGLTWQRCAVGQTWTGSMCNGFATPMNYTAANQQTSTLAGYSDWRIPSVNELKSIVEYKNYSPSINNVIFPSTPVNWFWSASNSKDIAWVVSFYDGNDSDSSGGKLNNYLLRLVRGTWSKPSPRIAPDISTTITQSTSNVKVNANVIYTASIKNNGTSDTGNVKIIFYLPPRNISTATLPSNCLLTEKNATCTLTNLAIGESISQSINVLYTKSGGASISALAISDKEDADISNNIGRVVTSIKK